MGNTNVQLFLFWQVVALPALSVQEPRWRRSPISIEWELGRPFWLIDPSTVLTAIGVSVRQMEVVCGISVVVATSKILATADKLQLLCQRSGPPYGAFSRTDVYAWDVLTLGEPNLAFSHHNDGFGSLACVRSAAVSIDVLHREISHLLTLSRRIPRLTTLYKHTALSQESLRSCYRVEGICHRICNG